MGDLAPDKTTYTPEEQADLSVALAFLSFTIQQKPGALLTLDGLVRWHATFGADVPRLEPGKLRSQLGMRATFGRFQAVPPEAVETELRSVFTELRKMITSIDQHLSEDQTRSTDPASLRHIVFCSVWLHAHLVRIHPFADGNGRMSRLAQTWVLARYGLLAVVFDDPSEYLAAINYFHDTAPRHDTGPLLELSLVKLAAAHQVADRPLLVRYLPKL